VSLRSYAVLVLAAAALGAGCASDDEPDGGSPSQTSAADAYREAAEEQGADPTDEAFTSDGGDGGAKADIVDEARRRLGTRADFKIPRAAVRSQKVGDVWWTVIERIYNELKLPYEDDPRYRRLTPGQRALYVLHWADSEIGNGGFSQFYFNSTGWFAADLPELARRAGAHRHARIAEQANAALLGRVADEVPRDRGARQLLLDRVAADAFDPFDDQWFADQDASLAATAARYVRAHPGEFFAAD
jgi:hypothetical protein